MDKMQYISDSEKVFLSLLKKSTKTKEEIEQMRMAGEIFSNELREETRYLLNEIKENGLEIDSIWDLVNTQQSYPEAIEPLRKHLSGNYHIRNKEGIIRALGVKESGMKEIIALLNEYGKFDDENYNFSVALSIHNIMKFYTVSELRKFNEDNDEILHELMTAKKIALLKFQKLIEELILKNFS